MSVRRFTTSDYNLMASWYVARGLQAPPADILSTIGYINDDACGFLYLTNSGLAIIDGYVSNPASPKNARKLALREVTAAIIESARTHGAKAIKADTQLPSVLSIGSDFGFEQVGTFTSFQRNL